MEQTKILINAYKNADMETIDAMIAEKKHYFIDPSNSKFYRLCWKYFDNHFDKALEYAAESGNMELVVKTIERGARDYNAGLKGACHCGHMEIINFMLHLGAKDYNLGANYASFGGHLEALKLMIAHGAYDIERYFGFACAMARENIVEYLANEYGIEPDEDAFYSLGISRNINFIRWFLEKYPPSKPKICMNNILRGATGFKYKELDEDSSFPIINFAIENGANDFAGGLLEVAKHSHPGIGRRMVELGARNYDIALFAAKVYENYEMIEYLEGLIRERTYRYEN